MAALVITKTAEAWAGVSVHEANTEIKKKIRGKGD